MSSISSSSLSMSSLIFLPFLASSGLAAAPSPPPSDGFVGRVSFFFCSAMRPSIGARDGVHDRPVTSPLTILTEPSIPQYLCHPTAYRRSEEHTSELQSQSNLVCRFPLAKK